MNHTTLMTVDLQQLSNSDLKQLTREQKRFLLKMDLCKRWQQNEKPTVESYLNHWPELREDSDLVLELVSMEFSFRQGQGESPELTEIVQRFPHLEEELEQPPTAHDQDDSEATHPSASLASAPAQRIADYDLIDELGRGGMGLVYRARQRKLDRLVALKMILHADYSDSMARERFVREAELIAKLQHPNIVQIFDFGEHEGNPYFSLELVEGGSLDRKLKESPLSPEESAQLVKTLANAIHAAHDIGVIHRDLKPANVLLTDDGIPKITDFGLARQLNRAGETQEGMIVGTPSYMSPEQAAGRINDISPATDVYALGAILYECLTARPPFKASTTAETILQVIQDEPVSVIRIQSKTPKDLETICLKCLQKDPKKRYHSAMELAEDLERFLDHRPIKARPVGIVEQVFRWMKRHPGIASLLLIIFLLLGIGMSLITWQWREAVHERNRAESAQQSEKQAHAETRDIEEQLTRALVDMSAFARDIGSTQIGPGNWSKAIESFELATNVLERRLARKQSVELLVSQMRTYAFLGVVRLKNGQVQQAMQDLQKSAELLPRLTQADPTLFGNRAKFGETCYVLGATLRIAGKPEQALMAMSQAVVHLQAALNQEPKNAALRKATSKAYFELGHLQRLQKLIAEAAETALERKKLWPDNPDEIYDAACELARCVSALKQDNEDQQREKFGKLAVETLNEALKKGLTNPKGILSDKDFIPLRNRDDFKALIQK